MSETARDLPTPTLHLLDLAQALASLPRLLILDEVTATLPADLSERVFRVARRWRSEGRSVVLINNPGTMLDTPFATVSNLRATLSEIGDIINPDEDVVMVYMSSHGTRDRSRCRRLQPTRENRPREPLEERPRRRLADPTRRRC